MVGDFDLDASTRDELHDLVRGKLRDERTFEQFLARIESAIAFYHAQRAVPNDEYFPRPREDTNQELEGLIAAADALAQRIRGAHRETLIRLVQPVEIAPPPDEPDRVEEVPLITADRIKLLRRTATYLSQAARHAKIVEPLRRGPRPQVAAHELAGWTLTAFEWDVNAEVTFYSATPTLWQRVLSLVFRAAGVPIKSDPVARRLAESVKMRDAGALIRPETGEKS
jgi:hypothetical protein